MTCSECGNCKTNGEMKEGQIVFRCYSKSSEHYGKVVEKIRGCKSFDWADPAAERFAAARLQ